MGKLRWGEQGHPAQACSELLPSGEPSGAGCCVAGFPLHPHGVDISRGLEGGLQRRAGAASACIGHKGPLASSWPGSLLPSRVTLRQEKSGRGWPALWAAGIRRWRLPSLRQVALLCSACWYQTAKSISCGCNTQEAPSHPPEAASCRAWLGSQASEGGPSR